MIELIISCSTLYLDIYLSLATCLIYHLLYGSLALIDSVALFGIRYHYQFLPKI